MPVLLRTVAIFFASLVLSTGAFAESIAMNAGAQSGPVIGQSAPVFTATDTHGVSHTLPDFQGRTVVLEWTNHDCPYVKKHYETGNMQKLQEEAAAAGAVWLSIVSSAPGKQGFTTPEEANEIMEKTGSHETARLLDASGDIARLYGAKTTPHIFVIDKDGVLAYAGAVDDMPSTDHATVEGATNYVRAALQDLAAGEPVKTAQTNPYGCSVKFGG